ncbi:MAG: pitrilysin family protein [Acholeplasmataceae bacterium]
MIIREDQRFHEKVYILKLKNGMEVHMLPKEDPYYSTYVELSFPFGSNHLAYKKDGLIHRYPPGSAHFMEHKIFAMPDGDAFMKFSNLGVDANAMTSYQQTSYVFNATSNVLDALKLLLNMLDTPYFTKENIMSEEKIIAEELKMYLDDIETELYQDLMTSMYKNHPFKWDIGGTLESIKNIDKEVLTDIFHQFYHPSNRLLVIAGKIDIKKMKVFFKAYDQFEKHKIPKIYQVNEPKSVVCKEIVKQKQVSISKLALGFKLKSRYRNGIEDIKNELTYSILFNLLLGTSSNLYHDLLEKQLINQNFYISSTFEGHQAHFVIFSDTKDPQFLKDYLITQLSLAKDNLLSLDAFNRYIKVYIGQFIFALNSVEHQAYLYSKYYHRHAHLYEVIDIVQSITYNDILLTYNDFIKAPNSSVIYKKD